MATAVPDARVREVHRTLSYACALMPAAFVDAGPRNRMYLSLRSGIPSQVDWALAELAAHTYAIHERLLLADFPGLDAALLDVVRRYCAACCHAPRADWDTAPPTMVSNGYRVDQGTGGASGASSTSLNVAGVGVALTSVSLARPEPLPPADAPFSPQHYARDATLQRQALDAALVLRNLALVPTNAAALTQTTELLHVVHDALLLERDDSADLAANLLEVLECVAPRVVLGDWVRAHYVQPMQNDDAPQAIEDRVYALLHALVHTTQDRALLLGALRCIRALASNGANAAALADADAMLVPTRQRLVSRCVSLLPLTTDPELLEAALDLLYQLLSLSEEGALLLGALTSAQVADVVLPSNDRGDVAAESLAQAIVHFLARNLALGKTVWERDTPITANMTAYWAADVPSAARARARRDRERRAALTPEERQGWKVLTPDERAALERLNEPERSAAWMRLLFERDAQGEVTQMDFWISYRDAFAPLAEAGGTALQPAATLIRNVSQTFPGAAAMVISPGAGAQPRFIIRGITPRLRHAPRPRCQWMACPAPDVPSWDAVREHLHVHCTLGDGQRCLWRHCSYMASNMAALERHAVTHLPTLNATQSHAPGASAPQASLGTLDNPGLITFEVERTPSLPAPGPGEPPLPHGVAFLSLLILRFVIRSAAGVLRRAGFGCPAHTYGGARPPTKGPAERDELFGFPLAALLDDGTQDTSQTTDERVVQAAVRIMHAATSIEDVLVETSLRNDILCRLANDTLVAIAPVEDVST